MKWILLVLTVCLVSGCGMEKGEMPLPSHMPSILPSSMPDSGVTESPVALSTFTTQILDTDPARMENLRLCTMAIDGKTVEPGGTFSFNETVGQRTAEKGYKEALMLREGKREKAIGGGVCQISSTLYNAANIAGMEILERHTHTGEVHYIPLGQDAAVSFGEQDFRFRNPADFPVTLHVSLGENGVTAAVYKKMGM